MRCGNVPSSVVLFHRFSCGRVSGPVKMGFQSACPGCDSAFLNKLSKEMGDSARRVLLNSTTQDRTQCGDLFRMAYLIMDRVGRT
jgi:hypothetical protein